MRKPWPTSPNRSSTGTFHILEKHSPRVRGSDSHLFFFLAERHAGGVRVDDECRHTLLPRPVDVDSHFREHGEQVRISGIRDPDLRAVDQIVSSIVAQRRRRLHRLGVRSRAGLGEAERRHELARRAPRQVFVLLHVTSE
jgi:hypothetical protein